MHKTGTIYIPTSDQLLKEQHLRYILLHFVQISHGPVAVIAVPKSQATKKSDMQEG
jgi:hypothetical protein